MVLIFDSFQPITVPFSEITDYQIEWICCRVIRLQLIIRCQMWCICFRAVRFNLIYAITLCYILYFSVSEICTGMCGKEMIKKT